MNGLIDELLRYIGVHIGHEAEATTLTIDGVAHDLCFPHSAKLLEVLHELGVGQLVAQTTNEDFVTHALTEYHRLILPTTASSLALTMMVATSFVVVTRGIIV